MCFGCLFIYLWSVFTHCWTRGVFKTLVKIYDETFCENIFAIYVWQVPRYTLCSTVFLVGFAVIGLTDYKSFFIYTMTHKLFKFWWPLPYVSRFDDSFVHFWDIVCDSFKNLLWTLFRLSQTTKMSVQRQQWRH